MGRGTANKYIRKFGRGTLTPLKPLELQKSIPYIVVSHMTKQICPKSIIQKMLSVEIFKKIQLQMETCKARVSSVKMGFPPQI